MKRKNLLLLPAITSLFILFPILTNAQENRYDYNEILNCETSLVHQDYVVSEALEQTKTSGVLIVIVRLGDGENSSELTHRRLYNLRQYFKQRGSRLKPEQVVLAAGERVKGYGRIEYYLNGKLHERLLFPRNGYICHSCCGLDERYYPEKANDERRLKRQQKSKKRT